MGLFSRREQSATALPRGRCSTLPVPMPCANAAAGEDVRRSFEARARRDYVGQHQAWNFVRRALESYI